ncbi:hypothetical protein FJY84_01380 [Candidatus Bathyarchaeota archaeon]|nr:hypothetical protein [Candidatus Bathyarchaeota archaeon]
MDNFVSLLNIIDDVLLPVPVYGVFIDDDLKFIVAGEISKEAWENIIILEGDGVKVYVGDANKDAILKKLISDVNEIGLLKDVFKANLIALVFRDLKSLVFPVSVAAFMDAINPCALSILLVILSLLYHSPDKRFILKTGIAYSGAVFLTYLIMGLGFLHIFSNITILKNLILIVPIFFGMLSIYGFFVGERKNVPESFSRIMNKYIEKVSNPLSGFVAGFVTGILVLPCSSAPYFIALNLLSGRATQFSGFILLVLYNLIIVLPFILITIGVHTLRIQTIDLRMWVSGKRRWINLLVGIGLILLSLYSLIS